MDYVVSLLGDKTGRSRGPTTTISPACGGVAERLA